MFETFVAILLFGLAAWLLLPEEKAQRSGSQSRRSKDGAEALSKSRRLSSLPRDDAEGWIDSGRR